MKLHQSFSIFMIPFYWGNGLNRLEHQEGMPIPLDAHVWELAKMSVEQGILFPHIQQFLQASLDERPGGHQKLHPHDYRIYALNVGAEPWKTLFSNPMSMVSREEEQAVISFQFLNDADTFLSPKLVICPNASVGVMLFAVAFWGKSPELVELMELNYRLHKTDKQLMPLYLAMEWEVENWRRRVGREEDAQKKQKGKEILQAKLEALERKRERMKALYQGISPLKTDAEGRPYWTIDQFVNLLFRGLKGTCHRFNPFRAHLFTYLQVEQDVATPELLQDFERIVRGQNLHYQVAMNEPSSYQQTFENIYIGSSVEGGGILTLTPKTHADFVNQFATSSLLPRYFWIYLMVVVQRFSLLYLIRCLTSVDDYQTSYPPVSLRLLRQFVRRLAEIKVNTYFTDVSDHTQHNRFYRFCCKQLCIADYFREIDEKMQALNEYLKQLADRKKEHLQEYLGLILALLTVVSASNDGIGLFEKLGILSEQSSFYTPATIVLIALIVLYIFYLQRKVYK